MLFRSILWRRNRDTVLTARADIVDNVQAPDVTNEIVPNLQPIMAALPYGYRIETGGSIEESVKANAALAVVFPVMAIAMLALVMDRASRAGARRASLRR